MLIFERIDLKEEAGCSKMTKFLDQISPYEDIKNSKDLMLYCLIKQFIEINLKETSKKNRRIGESRHVVDYKV